MRPEADLGHVHKRDPRPIRGTGTGARAAPRRTAGAVGREGARGASRREQVLVKVLVLRPPLAVALAQLAQAAVALAQALAHALAQALALARTKSCNWPSTGAIRRCGSGSIPSAPSLGTGRRPFWERQGTNSREGKRAPERAQ